MKLARESQSLGIRSVVSSHFDEGAKMGTLLMSYTLVIDINKCN